MKTRILAIGGRSENWVRDAVRIYVERLPPHLKPDIVEIPLSARSAAADPAVAMAKEGQRVLDRLHPGEFVVVLDERGRPWSSMDLAAQLERWQQERDAIAFVIGGPEGLAPAIKARADASWSLSPLTLPHGMVRVILAEQLYRAWSILRNHPYHKA